MTGKVVFGRGANERTNKGMFIKNSISSWSAAHASRGQTLYYFYERTIGVSPGEISLPVEVFLVPKEGERVLFWLLAHAGRRKCVLPRASPVSHLDARRVRRGVKQSAQQRTW